MAVRATRWLLITAPVVAGILVLLLGTAGAISVTFGMVLIGIGPIVWMWNWLVRLSFEDEDQGRGPRERGQRGPELQAPHDDHHRTAPHARAKLTGLPRRRP